MSMKMMPPKKSKAARSDVDSSISEEKPEEVAPERAPPQLESDEEPITSVPPKKKSFNIFDQTMVEGKRKRNTFTPEGALNVWLDTHFEDKAEVKLPFGEMYNLYIDKCMADNTSALEQVHFNKVIRKMFPEGFGHKNDSPLVGRIKERKIKKKEPKVKADTLTLKIRDIIDSSLKELGNPRSGVLFRRILNHIAGKYPALRLDSRPKNLLSALHRGMRYGYIVCEKGIGKCGYYKLYTEDESDTEHKEEKTEGDEKENDAKEGKKDGKDTEKSEEESADDSKEKKENGEVKADPKDAKDAKAKTKKPRKPKVPKDRFIHHGNPSRVEDTFYLAMTFGSEPKEASVAKIKRYIQDNYPEANADRLGKCLENGKEKGYWDQPSQGGKYCLEMASFDPTDDDDLIGMVINAIMACTEPKQCSASTLKKYVQEWYSDKFKIVERPHLFKRALQRALDNQEIKQLSGIGASGTFQLAKPFTPSPNILAGQDTPSDYDNASDSEDTSDEDAIESYDFAGYGDKYTPRPSKRRGMARKTAVHAKPAIEINEEEEERSRKRRAKRKAAIKRSRKRAKYAESSSEESSEEESSEEEESSDDEPPPPKKARARSRAPPPAKKKKAAAPAKKATPAKKGRGRSRKDDSPPPAKKNTKATKAVTKGRGRPSKGMYREDTSSEDVDSDYSDGMADGYRPTPSKSRGGGRARTPPPPAAKKSKATPVKEGAKKGRGRPSKAAPTPTRVRTPAAKKQGDDIHEYDSDSDEDSMDFVKPVRVETPAAKKQRSAVAPKARGRRR